MTPINVTIARVDLWDNKSIIYCGASLSLPATGSEIEDAMDRARVKNGQSYKVMECIDSNGDEMDYLPENPPLDQLNFLAKKLSEMDDYEIYQFKALRQMEKEPPSLLRLINITENMQDCLTIPANNYKELGEFILDNDMMEKFNNLPDEAYNCLDRAEVGRMWQKVDGGIFIDVGGGKFYAVNNSDEFREVYNENNIPSPEADPGYIFMLTVRNKEGETIQVALPALDHQLYDQPNGGISTRLIQCEIIESKCPVPNLPDSIYKNADIGSLNTLAHKISDLISNGEYPKYKALLEGSVFNNAEQAIALADSLGNYDFFPEVSCAEDYGREIFRCKHGISPDDPALEHLRFGGYGAALMEEHKAVKTEYGFIRKSLYPRQKHAQYDSTRKWNPPAPTALLKNKMEDVIRDITDIAAERAATQYDGYESEIDGLRDVVTELTRLWGTDEHLEDQFDMDVNDAVEAASGQQRGMTQGM